MKKEHGTVLMEAIICLPVLLLLSLGVAQFAHIWYCRTIVHYAAYSASRAVMTAPSGDANELTAARSAAEIVCAPIAFLNPTNDPDFSLPGVIPAAGNSNSRLIQGSGALRATGANSVLSVSIFSDSGWDKTVTVRMKVPLLVPFVGPLIGERINLWTNGNLDPQVTNEDFTGISKYANEWTGRINLQERVSIVKPFVSTWSSF